MKAPPNKKTLAQIRSDPNSSGWIFASQQSHMSHKSSESTDQDQLSLSSSVPSLNYACHNQAGSYETSVPRRAQFKEQAGVRNQALNAAFSMSNEFIHHIQSYDTNSSPQSTRLQSDKVDVDSAEFLSWKRLHLVNSQLEQIRHISGIMAGFGMVAMVEIMINPQLPDALHVAFATSTTLIVVINTLALMISSCILPHTSTILDLRRLELLDQSPHDSLRFYVQIAWNLSAVLGILLFMVQILLLCSVQYYNISSNAMYASFVIVVPALMAFCFFAWKFYMKLVKLKENKSIRLMSEMQHLASVLSGIPLTLSDMKDAKNDVVIDMPQDLDGPERKHV